MKALNLSLAPLSISIVVSFSLLACAKPADPPSPPPVQAPIVNPGVSPEEREKYCFLKTDLEIGQQASDLTEALAGTWTYFPSASSEGFDRKELRLDFVQGIAAITTYYDLGKDVDSIAFRKACLSKPLPPSVPYFGGYRFLELLATNNEGAVALLVRPDRSAGGAPLLDVSSSYYGRYATDTLTDPSAVLGSEEIRHIWIYQHPR